MVKTTLDISDALFARAKAHAQRVGRPLRSLVEEGLRRILEDAPVRKSYHLTDHSVGKAGGVNPLESMSWQDLRDEIYGGR